MKQSTQNLEVSSEQLSQYLIKQDPLLLFNLRDKDRFEKSHIKGSVHAVCNAQSKEKIMPKIPKNTKIILISEPEGFSKETAEMMASFGLDAYFLAGGFSSWNGEFSQGQTGKIIAPDELAKN